MLFFNQIRINSRTFQRVFCRIVINILNYTPHPSSIGADHNRLLRNIQHNLKISLFKFLRKLTGCLINHFHKIDIHIFHRNISTANLRRFYHILRQMFQPLGLRLQNIQISLNLRILNIFTFQQINIIND